VNDEQLPHELRLKRGSHILNYIRQFSATEKVVFGIFVIAAAVTMIIMAARLNSTFSVEIPAYGGSLNEGVIGLPRSINPVLALGDVDRDLSALIYSGLTRYSKGKIVGDLAQSFKVSADGLTYTFKLKPDLTFHDGTPLTTEDVAFTIQKIQDPAVKSPRRIDWTDVTVTIISPTEISFVLKQPYSPFLTNTTIGILPKHIWGLVSDEQFIFSQFNIEPIGSGPYRLSSISRDNGGIPVSYTLTSSREYYGKMPYIKTIIFNFFPEENAGLNALDQGSIDSLSGISPEAGHRLATDSAQPYTVLSSPLPRTFSVFLNQDQNALFADKTIRQALDMSIDRTTLIENVLKGYGEPLTGPAPFISSSSTVVRSAPSASTSIQLAQALLEKNGWKRISGVYTKKNTKTGTTNLSFDIYTVDSPDLKQAAELVKNAWTALGAHVTVKVYEGTDFYQNIIRTRKYDALLFGEVIGKDRDLYAFWHSSQRKSPGLNVAMYTNAKVDKLLDDIRTTNDEDARALKYVQFDQLIRADIPAIFLYTSDFIYAVPKSLKNIQLSSLSSSADRWSDVTQWYMETENVWNINLFTSR
jgi:peptide/nickel transport system substrate-binding protein